MATEGPRKVIAERWPLRSDPIQRGYIRHLVRIARQGDEIRERNQGRRPLLDLARGYED